MFTDNKRHGFYSRFFISGLCAIAGRRHKQTPPLPSPPPLVSILPTMEPSSKSAGRWAGRTISMTIAPASAATLAKKRRRKSSIAALPSRVRDCLATFDAPAPRSEKAARHCSVPVRSKAERDAEVVDVWITHGGPFVPLTDAAKPDPFAAAPESRSFFMDAPTRRDKHESFISLGVSEDGRDVRPVSVATAPAPRSRRASAYGRPESRDAYELVWVLEDGSRSSLNVEDTGAKAEDPTDIDWHQFHAEFLDEN